MTTRQNDIATYAAYYDAERMAFAFYGWVGRNETGYFSSKRPLAHIEDLGKDIVSAISARNRARNSGMQAYSITTHFDEEVWPDRSAWRQDLMFLRLDGDDSAKLLDTIVREINSDHSLRDVNVYFVSRLPAAAGQEM